MKVFLVSQKWIIKRKCKGKIIMEECQNHLKHMCEMHRNFIILRHTLFNKVIKNTEFST